MRTPRAARLAALKDFRRIVLRHYRRHQRDLPWRRTQDPYRILVSEVMLQQTQVDRVVPAYHRFLARFPTLRSLARADFSDVLRAWLGLGYNGRALRLWRCARAVVTDRRGVLPRRVDELERLPGIGPYTASAVSALAFDAHVPVVDVNVARVLSRALAGRQRLPASGISALARDALPASSAGKWAQALMDIGAAFCRSRPRCGGCPAHKVCAYVRAGGNRAKKSRVRRVASSGANARFQGSNRDYRGRVMRTLSACGATTLRALGRQVKPGFTLSDLPWLDALVSGLVRDGLVERRGRHVSLP
jgi:A/G-specific adenine glycosylase